MNPDEEAVTAAVLDVSVLPFDVERHREGLAAMVRLGLEGISLIPALRARDVVLVRGPTGKFRIDLKAADGARPTYSGPTNELIYSSDNDSHARTVRAEVERYFLRHFPGRIVAGVSAPDAEAIRDAEEPEASDAHAVYVTCLPF